MHTTQEGHIRRGFVVVNGIRHYINSLTLEKVRYMFGTGKAYTISGSGRDRKTGYRVGVMTKLGDIEEGEWKDLVKLIVEMNGQQQLFANLMEWTHTMVPWIQTKADAEEYTLQLFSAEIYDDAEWVDFIPFNRKYRPEILQKMKLQTVRTEECAHTGVVTPVQIRRANRIDSRISCPCCGKFAHFKKIKTT